MFCSKFATLNLQEQLLKGLVTNTATINWQKTKYSSRLCSEDLGNNLWVKKSFTLVIKLGCSPRSSPSIQLGSKSHQNVFHHLGFNSDFYS